MTGPVFVDTNVLVYARDVSDPGKQRAASAWIESLWGNRRGRLSTQVLHEFYVTVTRKLKPGMKPLQARQDVRDLIAWSPVPLSTSLTEQAMVLEEREKLSFWDALIVAAATESSCRVLLSEDFTNGRSFGELTVVSPFATDPAP